MTGGTLEAWGLAINGRVYSVLISCAAHAEQLRFSVLVPSEEMRRCHPHAGDPSIVRLADFDPALRADVFQCFSCLEVAPKMTVMTVPAGSN